jgi:hypothetical protein
MKKLLLFLCLIPLIASSQSADWKRYDNDSIIELDDNFKPIGFDSSVTPNDYSFNKFVGANFNFGQDSISITFLGTVAGNYITFRYIITIDNSNLHVRIQDGLYTPPKYDPAKYFYNHFGNADIIMLSIILGILIIIVLFNFKTIFKIK